MLGSGASRLIRAVLLRAAGLAVLGALVTAVLAAGRVLPVAAPSQSAPTAAAALTAAQTAAQTAASSARVAPPSALPAALPSARPSGLSTAGPVVNSAEGDGVGLTVGSQRSGLVELPRGGRSVFPRYRLVGYSGGPGTAAFGRLGIGDLDERVTEIEQLGRQYAGDREPLPVLELIAVVAQPRPGADGRYRVRVEDDVIRSYLDAARRHRALLLLNVQPGRANFLDEVKALEPWLRQPDIGLALDPEWAVGAGEVPGRVFGSTSGAELDRVARYVADLVIANRLPEKVVVVHQLAPQVIRDQAAVQPHWGVAMIKSADGIGSRSQKTATWLRLVDRMPVALRPGFKLFFEEDAAPVMTPRQVLALVPTPDYVLYE
jgi:hypothetical protein